MSGIEVKAPRKKKKGPKSDEPGKGKEPVHPGPIGQSEIAGALSWYGYFWDDKKSIQVLSDCLKEWGRKEDAKAVKGVSPKIVHPTYCHVARMMSNGTEFESRVIERFENHVSFLKKKYEEIKEEERDEPTSTPKPTVQDRVQEQAEAVSADIDYMIDEFLRNGYKDPKFKCYDWLDKQGIKPPHARKIADLYRPMIEELKEALEDKEMSEAYGKMKKADIKRLVKILENVVSDCETWAENRAKTQAPKKRKPKEKSVSKQVEKMQYLPEDRDLKIASIAPEKIPRSQELWLYNVKQKKLMVLRAMNRDGFTVSGTTVKGFDPDTSECRSVRKPQETIPRVLSGGKRVLKKLMDELTTKSQEAKGRVNGDTVILRAE